MLGCSYTGPMGLGSVPCLGRQYRRIDIRGSVRADISEGSREPTLGAGAERTACSRANAAFYSRIATDFEESVITRETCDCRGLPCNARSFLHRCRTALEIEVARQVDAERSVRNQHCIATLDRVASSRSGGPRLDSKELRPRAGRPHGNVGSPHFHAEPGRDACVDDTDTPLTVARPRCGGARQHIRQRDFGRVCVRAQGEAAARDNRTVNVEIACRNLFRSWLKIS